MREMLQFYVDCEWVNPVSPQSFDVINPATEDVCGRISLGSPEDADKAVAAAKKALPAFSQTSVEERHCAARGNSRDQIGLRIP